MRLTLQQIASALHADLPALAPLSLPICGVSTDSRVIGPGELFVALRGPNFDGHAYVEAAFERGAAAAVVESGRISDFPPQLGPLVGAGDTCVAYGAIAAMWRRRFDIPVVAVTGSVGKTSTKEMLAGMLRSLGPVLSTDKNENNEIGVPQLLLGLSDEHCAAVVEMGMRGAGQIAALAAIAAPTVGIVTRIGENHIELLGSMDSIADAKAELLAALPEHGLAIVNADDPFAGRLSKAARCRVETFGFGDGAGEAEATGLRAVNVRPEPSGRGWCADLIFRGEFAGRIVCPSAARHDLANALAAALAADELGVPIADAAESLRSWTNVGMRMDVVAGPGGATILSDCYNASPTSTRSALETLASFPASGRRIAFLGDMKELGDDAARLHADVSRCAQALGDLEMYSVGEMFARELAGAKERFSDSAAAADWAPGGLHLGAGDVVLVKGSRAMAMERIVEALSRPK